VGLGEILIIVGEFGLKSLKELDEELYEKFEWFFTKAVSLFVAWLLKVFKKK
jgi:hypothetical protein